MLKNRSLRRREISDTNKLLDYKESDISDWKARNSEEIEKYKTRAVKQMSEDVETGSRSEETGQKKPVHSPQSGNCNSLNALFISLDLP